jgi:hypothetical protein
MARHSLVAPAASPARDAKKPEEPDWRRRSLLRVRRPAWSSPAKPPANR